MNQKTTVHNPVPCENFLYWYQACYGITTARRMQGLHRGTATSVFGEVVHPVRSPAALQFAVRQRARRAGE